MRKILFIWSNYKGFKVSYRTVSPIVDLPDIRRKHHWFLQFVSQLLFAYSPPKSYHQNLTIQVKSIWKADLQNIMGQHNKSNNARLVLHTWSLAQYTKALHTSSSRSYGWLLGITVIAQVLRVMQASILDTAFDKIPWKACPNTVISSKSPAAWTGAAQILFKMCSALVLIYGIISITLPQDLMGHHNEQELVIAAC